MADNSKIEWTDATWSPITGCSVVSPGCTNCYAMRLAGTRLREHPSRKGLTRDSKAGPVWTGEVRFNEAWLTQPLGWQRPRMIFVCAHGDLFAESVTDEMIDRVFAVMALAPQHILQVLTKRSARMRAYLGDPATEDRIWRAQFTVSPARGHRTYAWPLPNVWAGVSAEDQRRADERIPDLLATPAAVRWVSAEPLLGLIDFRAISDADIGAVKPWPHMVDALTGEVSDEANGLVPVHEPGTAPKLDWIVVGGESGPGARPMHPDWARSLRDQCAAAGVPFHFKQWGAWLDEGEATAAVHGPGPDMFDAEGRPRGDRWHFYDPEDPIGGAMIRVGKKAAGRLLDGVEHNGMPATLPDAPHAATAQEHIP